MGMTHYNCTLEEAASEIGVSQSRAQQIEKAALRKCHQYLEARGIAPADLLDDASPLQQIDTSKAEQSVDAAVDQEAMTC